MQGISGYLAQDFADKKAIAPLTPPTLQEVRVQIAQCTLVQDVWIP